MCMNKPLIVHSNSVSNLSIVKHEEYPSEVSSYIASSSDHSPRSSDEKNIIEFGPIKVKPRKKPAPTLATGRRSKYEVLSPEEEQRRNIRRSRNRVAADRVRINRLNIEQDLQGQIDVLKEKEQKLLVDLQTLHHQKINLETRLLTHEKLCSPVTTPTTTVNSQVDLMSLFSSNDLPASTTFQQVDSVSELNFDELFFDSPLPVQTQQNDISHPLTTIMSHDDIDDYFIDS
jgi:hypothetical protein